MPAPGDAGEVHTVAVGPDAADAGDRTFAERDREGGEVEVLGGLDAAASAAALAAALAGGLGLLAEVGRPDDVAAEPHAAVEPRDDRALGGGGDAQGVEPRAFDALAGASEDTIQLSTTAPTVEPIMPPMVAALTPRTAPPIVPPIAAPAAPRMRVAMGSLG